MGCQGCIDPTKGHVKDQHAIHFKAWYVEGQTFQGCCDAWNDLPADGVIGVKVFFNDGTARNCMGNDWYGLFQAPDGFWTVIHNNAEDNAVRYPAVSWKRGMWTSEAEIHAVSAAMNAATFAGDRP